MIGIRENSPFFYLEMLSNKHMINDALTFCPASKAIERSIDCIRIFYLKICIQKQV